MILADHRHLGPAGPGDREVGREGAGPAAPGE
jgi:hypothetical protein